MSNPEFYNILNTGNCYGFQLCYWEDANNGNISLKL
jgi:hypothetical protein